MPSEPVRKLTAIMFIDMVGYTAMMQKNERRTQDLVKRQRELIKPLVVKNTGEVLRYIGDGTLCTFRSAIEAVNCSIDIQNAMKDEDELNLRIGIHIGDIVFEGDDIYGDGVNVASRLEPLAEPGGVCVSSQVYENIKNQPGIKANLLGEKVLKNVDHPIKIYTLAGKGLKAAKPFEEEEKAVIESKEVVSQTASKRLLPWVVGAAVLLIFFFGKGWFTGESSITEITADENSLAVMFIENMMDPTDEDRSAEMIKMLLTTDLSQSHSLKVISSQRLYDIAKQKVKNGKVIIDRSNATSIAKKARAQWMLTGTFSRIGSRMVLTTQLENVQDGKIIEAQRVDGDDLFSLIDMLSLEVKVDLKVVATPGEIDAPVKEITTSSSVAYQLYLEGLDFLNDLNFKEAIEKFDNALEIDSTFNKALYKLAVAQWWSDGDAFRETIKKILVNKKSFTEGEVLLVEGLKSISQGEFSTAKDIYQRLLLMYPDDKEIHYGLGEAYFHGDKEDRLKALAAFEEAINLDPEFTLAYKHIFDIYALERMYVRGIRRAKELVSLHPERSSGYKELGRMYMNNGDFDLALESYQKVLELNPKDYFTKEHLAWTYHLMGNYGEAKKLLNELLTADVPLVRRIFANISLAHAHAEQGQFKEAIEFTKIARILADSISVNFESTLYLILAYFHSPIGETATAYGFIDSALALGPSIDLVILANFIKGHIGASLKDQIVLDRAIDDIQDLRKKDGVSPRARSTYNILLMERYHLQGDIESALSEFNNFRDSKHWIDFSLYEKAILYLEKKDFDQSLTATKAMQAPDINRDFRSLNYPLAFYVRGMVYEEMGKLDLAIENYEALLDLWKDADEEIPERRDTIKRLLALTEGS